MRAHKVSATYYAGWKMSGHANGAGIRYPLIDNIKPIFTIVR